MYRQIVIRVALLSVVSNFIYVSIFLIEICFTHRSEIHYRLITVSTLVSVNSWDKFNLSLKTDLT